MEVVNTCESCGFSWVVDDFFARKQRYCLECSTDRGSSTPRNRDLLLAALDSSSMRAAIIHARSALRTGRYEEALRVLEACRAPME